MAANKNQISKDLTSKDQRPKTKETSEGDTETRNSWPCRPAYRTHEKQIALHETHYPTYHFGENRKYY